MPNPWWVGRWPGATADAVACPLCGNARHVTQRRITTIPEYLARGGPAVDVICYGDLTPPGVVLTPFRSAYRTRTR